MTESFGMDVPVGRDGMPIKYMRVDGWRVGSLLVHPTVGFQSGYYTVTHINTGLCIGTYINDRASAMWLAERISELGYNWEFFSKDEMPFTDEQKAKIAALRDSAKYDEEDFEDDDDL